MPVSRRQLLNRAAIAGTGTGLSSNPASAITGNHTAFGTTGNPYHPAMICAGNGRSPALVCVSGMIRRMVMKGKNPLLTSPFVRGRDKNPRPLIPGVLLLFSLLFISIAHASDQAREQEYASEIEESLVIGDAIRLEAGGQSFLALYTEADDDTKNAAIILHGLGVHPNWPDVIYPLRSGLAEHGWATLALQMPIGARDTSFDDALVLLPEAPPRIDAGIAYLREQGYTSIVLIAHSFGAQMATYYLANTDNPQVSALVSVGLTAAEVGAIKTADFMQKITIPMLDLYGSEDFDNVIATAPVRQQAQQANNTYTQQKVDGADHFFSSQDEVLQQIVQQWLEPFK
jgi:pimeloyl-ACP methyl ester carboxylesterase